MSSSTSNSSQPPRTPLHERSSSEKNKLQIRLVPYSPPRPETGASGSQQAEAEPSYDDAPHKAEESTGAAWTRSRTPLVEDDYGFDTAFDFSSPSSSPARATWSKKTRVSGSKQAPESFGPEPSTPSTPVANRPTLGSMSRRQSAPAQPFQSENAMPSPTRQRPQSRRSRVIKVHSDGTFSLGLRPARESDRTTSSFTQASTATSHELASFSAPSADLPSSPPSSAPERSVSPPTTAATVTAPAFAALPEGTPTRSPWSYRMIGGLRKVPHTPDLRAQKGKGKETETGKEVKSSPSATPLPDATVTPPIADSPLPQQTFNSEDSDSADSTIEETTNYQVLGRSSPPQPDSDFLETSSLPSSEGNYKVHAESSPVQPSASSPGAEFLDTPGSRNFVVHGGTPSSLATFPRRPRPQYSNDSLSEQVRAKFSQESLVIPPLKPQRKSSQERFGYYKRLSRESLRGRANSFSTISSIISQDTASLLVASTPNLVRIHRAASTSSFKQSSWAGQPGTAASSGARMDPQLHLWASQLSPVVSEYEGSDLGSRVASAASRGSSALGSRHSRQLLSIPATLSGEDEAAGPSQSFSETIERPSPAYMRGALPSPAVRDVDEHGDGLADLHQNQLQHKPSWRSYLSRRGSDRELHSAASSRAGSLTAASIPTWAWLYYGSGERRWLATVPSIQSLSEAAQSRPASSFISSSHNEDQATPDQPSPIIWNPRRRPREAPAPASRPVSEDVVPAEGSEGQREGGLLQVPLGPKKKTSSIWSPHLRFDRRAIRYSVWEPPSMAWTTEGGILGLRNVQILLFVVGFGVPLAWIMAAFLPLPARPVIEMFQQDGSATGLGISKQESEGFDERVALIEDTRFQNARWWRNLNRVMSVVGLLILGAIIALAVVGTHQGWGKT